MAQQKVVDQSAEDLVTVVDELQPGTKLLKGQYTITRFLNNGGFGITYLAKDSLNRNVVIKECFPNAFCRRSKTVVAARSRAHQAELRSVVQLFVREAHSLAKLVHPNIVAVHQVFEDNGTAYMAIDYIDGHDLLEVIEGKGARLSPEEIVNITDKLLSAVGFIHESDMLHRDISPDNVLINKKGDPILIDFGAAREQASRKSRALTALRVVKDGYSPQEFYIAGSEQGPWSDLYALGATLYHLIADEAPVNGQARLAALAENRPDPYHPLFGRFAGYPEGFLQAIDRVMNTIPKNRLQSAEEWLAMFKDGAPPRPVDPDRIEAAVHQMIAEAVVEPVAPVVEEAPVAPVQPVRVKARFESLPADAANAPVASAGGRRRRVPLMTGLAAAVVVAGIAITMTRGNGEATSEVAASAEVSQAEASGAGSVAVVTTEVAAAQASLPAPGEAESAAEPVAAESQTSEPAPTESTASTETTTATETTASTEAAAAPEAASTEPVVEEAAVAPAAETDAAAVPEPTGTLSAVQVAFAAWDVQMPFIENSRMVDGKPVAVVARVNAATDLALAGEWIDTGVSISALNDEPIEAGKSLAGMMLGALHVDPDGYARAFVDYTDASGSTQKGLLAARTVRIVNLANGIGLLAENVDGKWQTTVQSIDPEAMTTLQVGDVLFRDKESGVAIDGPETLEAAIVSLVETKTAAPIFTVVRGNKVVTAAMQLATDKTE